MWGIELGVVAVVFTAIFFVAWKEKRKHQKNIDSIPVRININGVRGKSTVTRLITGVMQEGGYKTIGKTTGTDARMLYWFENREDPIKRRIEGPNIGEQKKVLKTSVDKGAEALVSECMAVNPDYQKVFQGELLQANIVIIVNVLHDHMEVLGPTLDHVAEAFAETIPYSGHLIINNGPYAGYFGEIAAKRKTEVIVIDETKVSEKFLQSFSYMLFPENVALASAVADVMGIDSKKAEQGMLKAWPDPGAMRVLSVGEEKEPSYFINGFAANDATSTINIWKRVEDLGFPVEEPVIIVNCREDRVERTKQFAEDVLPYLPAKNLVLIGSVTEPIVRECENGNIQTEHLLDLADWDMENIISELAPFFSGRTIYGIGNIHGMGEPLIQNFEIMAEQRELIHTKKQSFSEVN